MRPAHDRFHGLVRDAVEARRALDGLPGRPHDLGATVAPVVGPLTADRWGDWEAARQRCEDAQRALVDYVRRPIS